MRCSMDWCTTFKKTYNIIIGFIFRSSFKVNMIRVTDFFDLFHRPRQTDDFVRKFFHIFSNDLFRITVRIDCDKYRLQLDILRLWRKRAYTRFSIICYSYTVDIVFEGYNHLFCWTFSWKDEKPSQISKLSPNPLTTLVNFSISSGQMSEIFEIKYHYFLRILTKTFCTFIWKEKKSFVENKLRESVWFSKQTWTMSESKVNHTPFPLEVVRRYFVAIGIN